MCRDHFSWLVVDGCARPGVRRTSHRRSQPRTDRERRSHCRRPPRIRSDRSGRQIRVATESGASSRIRRHPPGRVVCRPIHFATLDEANGVTLLVEGAIAQSMDVSGTAPAIEVSTGASTSLVNGADITLRHPVTVGEILENIPGVSVISEGQSATPAIRGLARGRTSIMVDGSRASSERRAGANASFLDPAIVERVEVARGPASVAYGSDAMGGVIAARTRGPDYARPLQVRFAGTLGGGFPRSAAIWKCRLVTETAAFSPACAAGTSTATTHPKVRCRTPAGAMAARGCDGSMRRRRRCCRSAGRPISAATSDVRAATWLSSRSRRRPRIPSG